MPDIQRNVKVDSSVYFLPHDNEEGLRLELQHRSLRRAFDDKILCAPVELQDDDWVLDMGTGTGIWLRELANELPTKPQFHGVDIESNFFPQPSALPDNMRFETNSVLNLPGEWTSKFMLTHQRLLIAGLRRQEWEQALGELYRVLKPGGWIQLLELQRWPTSGPALAKYSDLVDKFSNDLGIMSRDVTPWLLGRLKQSGFVDIHLETRGTPLGIWANQDGVDGKKNIMGVFRGYKAGILRGGGYGVVGSETEYDELGEEMSKELDLIPGSALLWTMFWAQKPLE